MRDYIVYLRAILSKFDRPWTEERQLELLYDNILPRLQFKVRQEEVTSVNKLIELAREVEAQLDVERNFREPPNPKSCIMPEVVYQNPSTSAKPLPPHNKSSLDLPKTGSKADDAARLAAVAAQSPADLSKLISKLLDEKLAQFGIKPNKLPNSPKRSGAFGSKGAYRKTSINSWPKERKGSPTRKNDATVPSPRLASAKNKGLVPRQTANNKQPGSKTFARCWGAAGQAIPKAIAPSARETTSGTTT